MKNTFTKIIFILCIFSITGCEQAQDYFTQQSMFGTLSGVHACYEKNKDKEYLISLGLIKSLCTEKHEHALRGIEFPSANFRNLWDNFQEYDVSGISKSKDIYTKIILRFTYFDKNGKELAFIKKHNNWTLPNANFFIEGYLNLPLEKTQKIEFCKSKDKNKDCLKYTWEVKGVALDL